MKPSICFLKIALVFTLAFLRREAVAATRTNAMIRVLFLGYQAGHKPAQRFALLQPVMAARNIEMTYTETLDDLNPGRLAQFDCLMIYANHPRISPEQEQALMDFVQAGGGFAPVHCASYCFHNSSDYIALVGAEFQRHGTGVFRETIIQPDHPVMRGLSPIESWDETYAHHKHNTNRIVLAERRDASGAEPYTWVREHGKGRVFYTAWGHDQRTWTNAGFQALLERGVRWASANSPSQLKARAGLRPFEYEPSPPLPNYLADAPWGAQGEPLRTMQKPLAPEESAQHLVTLPGFDARLFASEPNVIKPIWMAWDTRGRLWVCESVDYPNDLQPEGQGHDRLKIVEDKDGDGRADKFTVFADRLSIPTGFVFANGGVIVIHSGRTEFLKDTNGDDRADARKVLFAGWGTKDTHATASNLRYGFDGWIYGTVGYSGFDGVVGGRHLRFGQGFFRFKSDGSAMEYLRASNNNTWGLGITEDNLIFGSTANNNASMYLPIPNRYYEAVHGWSAARLETSADNQRIYPLTDKVRQVDVHGRYTAGAGSAIYTARSFPKTYWNRFQFVAEPTGHLLGQFFLESHGTDFVARNARNFAASDDEWTAPVCAEVGPDGALWMIDWYNYVVQHNPTPRGFQTGKGSAYETPLRDKTHGRIYRIISRTARTASWQPLDHATPQQLVAGLRNDNLLWRMHAQRLLVERGRLDVVPALCELAHDPGMDEIGLNPAAIHALWTLKGLGAFEGGARRPSNAMEALAAGLVHASAAVRRAAIMVAPRDELSLQALLKGNLLSDADPHVRLATLLALSEMPPSEAAGAAAFAALQEPRNARDRWIADAVTAAGARHDAGFLKTALMAKPSGEGDRVVRLVTAHYAQRGPVDTILSTLSALQEASPAVAGAVLDGLVAGWPQGRSPLLGDAEKEKLNTLMASLPQTARDRLLALAQRWGQGSLFGTSVPAIIASLKKEVTDVSAKDDSRAAAAKRLIALEDKPEDWKLVLEQVALLTPPDLAVSLVNALGESRDGRVSDGATAFASSRRDLKTPSSPLAEAVIEHWAQFTPTVRRAAIVLLMRRSEWAGALLQAIENRTINRTDLAPEHWAQLKQYPDPLVSRRAERLSERGAINATGREEIVVKFLPLAKEKGDPARGRGVFTTNCAVCHTFNGEGKNVGPDLTGIGARERSEILADILDPNRSVEANYRAWIVTTKDNETYTGRLESETQTTVEILDANAQKHVFQRKDIASMQGSQLSIMPNGFETLPPDDLKGLLEYLTQGRQERVAQ